MKRILVPCSLSEAGLALLEAAEGIEFDTSLSSMDKGPEKQAKLREMLPNFDGMILRSSTEMKADDFVDGSNIAAIARAGVGVDNIDLTAATRAGVVVMNTPGGNTTSTAELTITMMLALCRNVGPAYKSMTEGRWDRKKFTGTQVAGKTIGIVGLGRIGLEVASRCAGLEMDVVGYDPFMTEERAKELGIEFYKNLDDMLDKCDFITVHVPKNEETTGLLNAERIAKMKQGVRLINCARGGIIDEQALADGIKSGQVAGAALDVYTSEPVEADNPVLGLDNVLTVPHLGASTAEAQENVALEAVELMIAYLTRGEIKNAINMASVSAKEMNQVRPYLNLSYRLGLMMSQTVCGKSVKGVKLDYRGEAADKPTKLITSSFLCGLLSSAMTEGVHIVNAAETAKDRGIEVTDTKTNETGAFSTLIGATVECEGGSYSVAGTMLGNEFLRLVRLEGFQLDAYLDGLLLIYRHRDVPGLIGAIGTTLGQHEVNISHMALGRAKNEPGGDAVAVLNLDSEPSADCLEEIKKHPEVTGVQVVKLPNADEPLPWLGG